MALDQRTPSTENSRFYAIAYGAARYGGTSFNCMATTAASIEEAVGIGVRYAHGKWPDEEGWHSHGASAMDIDLWLLKLALERAGYAVRKKVSRRLVGR